ncbi:hypothetical protein GGR51DRAFT_497464 [Nemania sp. FL0031]|nr:hypothetical protein GGR51DRAFT_497464 [Nemania sp. FL0031]
MADNITHDSTEPARSDIFDIFFVMTYEKYIWLPVRVGAFVAHIFLLISSLRAGGFPIIIAEDLAANPDILLAIGLVRLALLPLFLGFVSANIQVGCLWHNPTHPLVATYIHGPITRTGTDGPY